MESEVFCGGPGAESATLRFLLAFSLVLHLMVFFGRYWLGKGFCCSCCCLRLAQPIFALIFELFLTYLLLSSNYFNDAHLCQ